MLNRVVIFLLLAISGKQLKGIAKRYNLYSSWYNL